MKQQKILFIGGPGTGKSSLIGFLGKKGFPYLHEISREVTLKAQREGVDQLFLTEPLLFSEMLMQGRIKQFEEAAKFKGEIIFIDRGIPDVTAYLDYVKNDYPPSFSEANRIYRYDKVFLLPIWKEIYDTDNERYESYDQALEIQKHLVSTYGNLGYELISVPKANLSERAEFVLERIGISL